MQRSSVNQEITSGPITEKPSIQVVQHSILKSILLHLLPGAPILLVYIIAAPFFVKLGFPPAFALCLAIPIALIPTQLGILLFTSKKEYGEWSLKSMLSYTKKVSVWQYIVFGIIIIAWSGLCFMILSKPVGGFLIEKLFSWAPEWFINGNTFEGSKKILLITWIMIMVLGNILGPIVEELYFRGYLLPRISRLKGWAIILNAVLFATYHFWSPWEVITRSIAVLPVSYIAYKKRNIYIGMIAHVVLNIVSSMSLLFLILKMS